MLQTLANLDPPRAARVLSLAARQVLPQPRDDQVSDPTDEEAAADLIREISRRAAARKLQSKAETADVQEALSREISAYLLKNTDPAAVRDRVGEKGALSPSLYRVSFSKNFDSGAAFWGISKSHVVRAIAQCDQVQHFSGKLEARFYYPYVSLFGKIAPTRRDPYTIIVTCRRVGATLIAEDSYRVYHNEIDLIGAKSPLEILSRFLDKFGEEVETGVIRPDGTFARPSERKKLLHETVYYVKRGETVFQKFPNNQQFQIGPVEDDTAYEALLTFSVNVRKYIAQLSRHGVKSEPPTGTLNAFSIRHTST